jgi:uncharacterized protein with GYD domain
MPWFMIQLGYKPEAWNALIANPQNRIETVRPVIEGLGGRIHHGWLTFGEYDLVAICEMPDNISAAAFSLAVEAGGAVEGFKTTPLLTMDEGIAAMKKASTVGYKPPKG